MAGGISWKEFEAIVMRLHKSFESGGIVTPNDRILGRKSNRKRQIDISIRTNIGGIEILFIVECKRWNRKPDVKAVEAFAGLKEDVGAHIGIMVSTKGFSQAAYRIAEHEKISLYRYEDSIREGWPNGLNTHVLLEVWELTPNAAYLVLSDGSREPIESDLDVDVVDVHSGKQTVLAGLVKQLWETVPARERRDDSWLWEVGCTTPERPEVKKMGIGAISKLVRGYRKGKLLFEGLVDEKKGSAKVDGWKMIFTGELIPLRKDFPPGAETMFVMMKSVHVRTLDPRTEKVADGIYTGVLELEAKMKQPSNLHVDTKSSLSLRKKLGVKKER